MKNKANAFQIILGFVLIGIALWLFYILSSTLIKYITLVSPNIIAAIIAGLVTVIGYFISRNFERKKIIEQQIREKKLPVYEEFINFLFEVLKGSQSDKPMSALEMQNFMFDFNKRGIVWLSDSSLKAFIKWKDASIIHYENNEENMQYLFILEELLLEFRKDIGHTNKNLKKGDLLKLFINDMNKYIE
jgi:flagellar motor component MotA